MAIPLRVTFNLVTPIVAPVYPIHLDSLIAYGVTQTKLAALRSSGGPAGEMDNTLVRSLADSLPLAREVRGDDWVWKASALIPSEIRFQSIRMMTRKSDPYEFAKRIERDEIKLSSRATTMISNGAPYTFNLIKQTGIPTPRLMFYPVQHVASFVAWCVGEIDEIEDLLNPENGIITSIGKSRRISHGIIQSVSIEEDPEAHTQWLRRVLPWPEEGYVSVDAATRPPYWAPENRKTAFMPGDL